MRDCEQVSNACAMAMVESGGMVSEVRSALDCADVCEAAERVLSRSQAPDLTVVEAIVEAAAVACQASRLHSASAQACADALRALQKVG